MPSGGKRSLRQFVGIVLAQEYDSGMACDTPDPHRRLNSTQSRHRDIENHNVGLKLFGGLNSFQPVRRFSNDLESLFPPQQVSNRFPREFVILNHENTNIVWIRFERFLPRLRVRLRPAARVLFRNSFRRQLRKMLKIVGTHAGPRADIMPRGKFCAIPDAL